MTFVHTIDPALRIRTEDIIQQLGSIDPVHLEMMSNVFKNKKNVDNTTVTRELISQTIQSLPFVGDGSAPVALNGETISWDRFTVPSMKGSMRISASEFSQVKNLRGKDRAQWLREKLVPVKRSIEWSTEYYLRSFLATGNHSYKVKIGDAFHTLSWDLGTAPSVSAPSVLFDNSSATISGVIQHLDSMFEAGNDDGLGNGYFQDPDNIIVYARKAVWNAIADLIDNRQTNDVVRTRVINKQDLLVGDHLIRKFDGAYLDPEDQSATQAITAKQLRMVDVSAMARHTLAYLEIENLNAVGGQKHVLTQQVQDPYGQFMDVHVEFRPLGMFIPEAMVTTANVIS